MPAFSPGPCTTLPGPVSRVPLVGRRLRCTREDLYEQCSDHITEKIPSSVSEGVRPSASSMRVYSSGVMLWVFNSAGVMVVGVGGATGVLNVQIGHGSLALIVAWLSLFVGHSLGNVLHSRLRARYAHFQRTLD